MIMKKSLYYVFYIAAVILMFATIFSEFLPIIYISEGTRLIITALSAGLLIAANIFIIGVLKESDEKIKTVRKSIWLLFIFYAANLFILLFISYGRTRTTFLDSDMSYKIYFRYNTNFIPLKGIIDTFKTLGNGNLRYALTITFGNLFAFAPMAFFIPTLFKRINNLKRFTFLMITMIISVECSQFITMTGSMDIDDLILNFSGAVMIYGIIRIKLIENIFKRLYIKE